MSRKDSRKPAQQTDGGQSPAIAAEGDVTLNYGMTPALQDWLAKELDAKNISIAEKDNVIAQQAKTLQELQESLSGRPPDQNLAANAREQLERGNIAEAQRLLKKSFRTNRLQAEEKAEQAAIDAFELAKTFELQLDYEGAQKWYEKALLLDPINIIFLGSAGVNAGIRADYQTALKYYSLALEFVELKGDNAHPELTVLLNNIGSVWARLGEPQEAIGFFQRALEIELVQDEVNDAHIANLYNNIGGSLHDLTEHKEALTYYRKAYARDLKTYKENHPKVANRIHNIGGALLSLGHAKKATKHFEKALKINMEIYGQFHPSISNAWNNMGAAAADLGNLPKALKCYQKALAIDLEVFGSTHPIIANRKYNIASGWWTNGEHEKAIQYNEEAYEILLLRLGEKHPDTLRLKQELEYMIPRC